MGGFLCCYFDSHYQQTVPVGFAKPVFVQLCRGCAQGNGEENVGAETHGAANVSRACRATRSLAVSLNKSRPNFIRTERHAHVTKIVIRLLYCFVRFSGRHCLPRLAGSYQHSGLAQMKRAQITMSNVQSGLPNSASARVI